MRIVVIGAGYVGLTTAACLAETGLRVVCVDRDREKVARLSSGECPIFEPGLSELTAQNLRAERLSFSADLQDVLHDAQVIVIAVGTPTASDGSVDMAAVDRVAEEVRGQAKQECVVVMKSTVPVGTHARLLREVFADASHIHLVSNPEFLKEGEAIADFLRPERIIIGVDKSDSFARRTMRRLYHPLQLSKNKTLWMDPASAELSKYAANAMLAMRISFMNEMASLCEVSGADIRKVRHGIGSDSRIGPMFLHAGPGYGGSCFPKDVRGLAHRARELGVQLALVETTEAVNRKHQDALLERVKELLGMTLEGKRICMWGLAFKPKTDDVRESPALTLVRALLDAGANVSAHDPQALHNARNALGAHARLALLDDPYDAAEGAELLVLATEWREYQNADFEHLGEVMATRTILDLRNVWAEYALHTQGFRYRGLGVRRA